MLIPQEREKHLLFLIEGQKQILRSARDDTPGGLFQHPARLASRSIW